MSDVNIDEMLQKIMSKASLPDIDKESTREFTRTLSKLLRDATRDCVYDVDFVTVLSMKGGDGRALAVVTTLSKDEQEKLLTAALNVQSDPSAYESEVIKG